MIPKATTNQERHATIAAIAAGFALGHAITTFGAPETGAGIGIAAAAAITLFIIFFDKQGEELAYRARLLLRSGGGILFGLAAGATTLYKNYPIDVGLVLLPMTVSLIFFALAYKGNRT